MQDTGLWLSLAEIAGVFVGFGALIAVRSGGASGPLEVAYMRAVVWMGLAAVVAALAPVVLDRYGLAAHEVWALSTGLVLVGYGGMAVYSNTTAELWAARAARSRKAARAEAAVSLVLFGVPMVLAVIVILLGLQPQLEAALYLTVVVLILLGAAMTLLELVFAQRGPVAG